MAGWDLKSGEITEYAVSEDKIWSLFNYVFSDASKKRNTYKFGLVKSLLDSVFNGVQKENGIYYSFRELFEHFTYNYWNLIVKYDLRQMRKDKRSTYSRLEVVFQEAIAKNPIISNLEFESIDEKLKADIISKVTKECKRCVVGALYEDFDGIIYSFDVKEEGLTLNPLVYDFMLKHKSELEKLNYFAWAKFLEQINDDSALIRVLGKLEMATPRREDLSIYREILRKEFEENTCFYCGRLLHRAIHVDHFIPWSFVKDDKIWNFVLACPECNLKKNNRLPDRKYLLIIEDRNKKMIETDDLLVQADIQNYDDELLNRMWAYAKMSGLKEYKR